MREYTKTEVAQIAQKNSVNVSANWSGIGPLWPLCEKMMQDGSVVIVKLDGQRTAESDNGKFTVIAMDGPLGETQIRGDFVTLDEALCYLVGNYFALVSGG